MAKYDFTIKAEGSQTYIEAMTIRAEEWMDRWKGIAYDAGPTIAVPTPYAEKLLADFRELGLTVDDSVWAPRLCKALRKYDHFDHVTDEELRGLANNLLQAATQLKKAEAV